MTPADDFVNHCAELLSVAGPVRVRRMFGGHGLYVDGVFAALIADERLYLKADAQTEARFAAAGCERFTFEARGRRIAMSYWSAPDAAMDSPAAMAPWARLALQAALAARGGTAKRPRAVRSVKPTGKPAVKPVRAITPRAAAPAAPAARKTRRPSPR